MTDPLFSPSKLRAWRAAIVAAPAWPLLSDAPLHASQKKWCLLTCDTIAGRLLSPHEMVFVAKSLGRASREGLRLGPFWGRYVLLLFPGRPSRAQRIGAWTKLLTDPPRV